MLRWRHSACDGRPLYISRLRLNILSTFWTPLNYKVLKSLKHAFYFFGISPQRQEKDCTESSTNVQSRNFHRCEQSHSKEPKYSSTQYQQMGLVVLIFIVLLCGSVAWHQAILAFFEEFWLHSVVWWDISEAKLTSPFISFVFQWDPILLLWEIGKAICGFQGLPAKATDVSLFD